MSSLPSIPMDQLNLLDVAKLLLGEIQISNRLLERQISQQDAILQHLGAIGSLVDHFTDGGAHFAAYQTDPLVHAYLSVSGPLMASRILQQNPTFQVSEVQKAAVLMAREMLEEFDAYRQEQAGRDTLERAMGSVHDPWEGSTPPEDQHAA